MVRLIRTTGPRGGKQHGSSVQRLGVGQRVHSSRSGPPMSICLHSSSAAFPSAADACFLQSCIASSIAALSASAAGDTSSTLDMAFSTPSTAAVTSAASCGGYSAAPTSSAPGTASDHHCRQNRCELFSMHPLPCLCQDMEVVQRHSSVQTRLLHLQDPRANSQSVKKRQSICMLRMPPGE